MKKVANHVNVIKMMNKSLSLKAAQFAYDAHNGQVRKYTNEPYINHAKEVAEIVASVTDDEEMIASAYLHDVVEDTNITLGEIESVFGPAVAGLVSDLTDVSRPTDGNRAKRKEIDRKHTAGASPRAKTVKLADLISNSKNILQYDPDFAKVYLREKKLLLEVLRDGNAKLWAIANEIVEGGLNELR